ncbi:MAG TPA: hypothetical protein DIC56_23665 [Rhizobium sp.]|nr:hypothetical protein [Rhizobium sp.]
MNSGSFCFPFVDVEILVEFLRIVNTANFAGSFRTIDLIMLDFMAVNASTFFPASSARYNIETEHIACKCLQLPSF